MRCEYDGTPLPTTPDGRADACPTCDAEADAHALRCRQCREQPNLPERGGLDMGAMLKREVMP